MVYSLVLMSNLAISPEMQSVSHMLPSLPSSIECGPRYLPGKGYIFTLAGFGVERRDVAFLDMSTA